MKKAFDANVSKAKPRVRLGALMGGEVAASHEVETPVAVVEALAQQVANEPVPDLASALRRRQEERAERPATAAQALHEALAEAPAAVAPPAPVAVAAPAAVVVKAAVEAPAEVTEVQSAPAEVPLDADTRRERLKERLKAVRENPRPDPLPETVAEAGVLAVERISVLQSELAKARALNLALTQDLEAARRQSERATEEARLRMDEARRLAHELEGRAKLLSDLERELASLEGERDEALLSLQEARQGLEAGELEKAGLRETLGARQRDIEASLAEEERLAGELEAANEHATSLQRANDALKSERDTLARQVSDLTRERAELLEARKALEAVHRALAKAVTR